MTDPFFSEYTTAFYDLHNDSSHAIAYRRMAEVLREEFDFRTVVDVGCGLGNLLAELGGDLGIGIEAPDAQWPIRSAGPKIPLADYVWLDLREPFNTHKNWNGYFDLAISVEVAEHLPKESALGYVRFLCSLSNTIVFSAAFPGQGGTAHINEQPFPYWVGLFEECGFRWDVETSQRIQAKLRGKVGGLFWYENLNVLRRKRKDEH